MTIFPDKKSILPINSNEYISIHLTQNRGHYIVAAYEWFVNSETGLAHSDYKVQPTIFDDKEAAEKFFDELVTNWE